MTQDERNEIENILEAHAERAFIMALDEDVNEPFRQAWERIALEFGAEQAAAAYNLAPPAQLSERDPRRFE